MQLMHERVHMAQVEDRMTVDGDHLSIGHMRVAGGGCGGEASGEHYRLLIDTCAGAQGSEGR